MSTEAELSSAPPGNQSASYKGGSPPSKGHTVSAEEVEREELARAAAFERATALAKANPAMSVAESDAALGRELEAAHTTPHKRKSPAEDDEDVEDGERRDHGSAGSGALDAIMPPPQPAPKDNPDRKKIRKETPDVSGHGRVRSKPAQYVPPAPASTAKSKEIRNEGAGTALGDIEAIRKEIDRRSAADEVLRMLHRVLYGRPGSANEVKRNVRAFKGLAVEQQGGGDDGAEAGMRAKLEKFSANNVRDACKIFQLENYSGDKSKMIGHVVDFLKHPTLTPKAIRVVKNAEKAKVKAKRAKTAKDKAKAAPASKATKASAPESESESESESSSSSSSSSDDGSEHDSDYGSRTKKSSSKGSRRASASGARKGSASKAAPRTKKAADTPAAESGSKFTTADTLSSSDDEDEAAEGTPLKALRGAPSLSPRGKEAAHAAAPAAAKTDEEIMQDKISAEIVGFLEEADLETTTKKMVRAHLSAKFDEELVKAHKLFISDKIAAVLESLF